MRVTETHVREKKMELNPAFVEAVKGRVNQAPFFRLMGMSLLDLKRGSSQIVLPVRPDHLQPYGMVHGGVCSALVDAACFWAVCTEAKDTNSLTTVELKLNYLGPVKEGVLKALGRCIKMGKRLGLGEAQVLDQSGRLVAHGTSTLMVVEGLALKGEEDLPPKYLG
jgi:uncharacterized protein (TIGR00369 family)